MEGSATIPYPIESVGPEIDIAFLVETYSRTLFRVAYSVLRSTSDAEDVLQEVFVRVLTHQNELRSVQDMRVWLVRIAWNLALDARRRIRPEQMDLQFIEGLVGSKLAVDKMLTLTESIKNALREIDRLPKVERQVLLLSAVDELGTVEVAAVMGKSESAVRALLFRARTRLRERLDASEMRSRKAPHAQDR